MCGLAESERTGRCRLATDVLIYEGIELPEAA